ncbi:SPOR domain-containing protein [Shewanella sp. GXUN23E]|uniref:SPOR domain-containing protein n=1 Tax=Shewanella sp. GXUN23E TaxID=3422498 RepID=UPI003D7E5A30
MSSQFHNRLVGTIVVVALGVIFLPDVLDGKKDRVQEEFAEIPLRPQSSSPQSAQAFEVISPAESMATETTEHVDTEPPKSLEHAENGGWVVKDSAAPGPTSDNQPKAKAEEPAAGKNTQATAQSAPGWTLQLGSFRDAGNVQGLVEQLREAGFNAYTLPRKPVHGSITKVFVGPDVNKAKVEKLMSEVEKLTKLKGRVVPFDPLEN